MKKLKLEGWIENGSTPATNIPSKCPGCGGELWQTDALKYCNQIIVGCKNSRCRWCQVYYIEGL